MTGCGGLLHPFAWRSLGSFFPVESVARDTRNPRNTRRALALRGARTPLTAAGVTPCRAPRPDPAPTQSLAASGPVAVCGTLPPPTASTNPK